MIQTPGHSADSVCLLLEADGAVLTGDTVLGRGTTVIGGDGSLSDYLSSLDRLRALADTHGLAALLPGHGPILADPAGTLDYYIAHRAERLAEVTAAVAAGETTLAGIVARVYADVDRALWPFAEWSVRAQLAYLAERGELRRRSVTERYRALLRIRSGSISSTDLGCSWIQPRATKSARALLTVSRDAPTSWASSSWVRS